MRGLRNRDLVKLLYPRPAADAAQRRRRSAAVGRKIRLLRAHGLLRKVPRSHRYLLSRKGREALTVLLAAAAADAAILAKAAA